jgi:hypothetical protein
MSRDVGVMHLAAVFSRRALETEPDTDCGDA